jgi:hypothetical protein
MLIMVYGAEARSFNTRDYLSTHHHMHNKNVIQRKPRTKGGDNMSFLHHGQYYTLEELVQHLEELEA